MHFIKNIFSIYIASLFVFQCYSQNIAINTTGNIGDQSAILDVSSTYQGVLVPRINLLSTTDAITVPNPANSLLVYNTNAAMFDGSLGYWYNSGTTLSPVWKKFADTPGGFTHYLGEYFNGGIIYYLYRGSDGLEHGLIVSTSESPGLEYQTLVSTTNANRSEDGVYNSGLITNSPSITYVSALGPGWYLPSLDELMLLFNNRYIVNKALRLGGFTLVGYGLGSYWSSTEDDMNYAYSINFFTGESGWSYKLAYCKVRAIKSF